MGRTSLEILEYFLEMPAEEGVQPSQFKGRIIFMPMYNEINWWENICRDNAIRVASFAKSGNGEKWYGSLIEKTNGEMKTLQPEIMMQECARSGHPMFKCSSPLTRGVLKSKGRGRPSIHYNAHPCNAAMLLKTVVSVNQLIVRSLGQRRESDNVAPNENLNTLHRTR